MASFNVSLLLGSNSKQLATKFLASLEILLHTGSSKLYRHRLICSTILLQQEGRMRHFLEVVRLVSLVDYLLSTKRRLSR